MIERIKTNKFRSMLIEDDRRHHLKDQNLRMHSSFQSMAGDFFFTVSTNPNGEKRICCCVLLIDPQGVWECKTEKSK